MSYLTDVPIRIDAEVRVNRAALSKESAFWKLQPVRTKQPGQCTRSDVEPFVPLVLRHEGIPINPRSHAAFFKKALDQLLGPAVEGIVEEAPFQVWRTVAFEVEQPLEEAAKESERADTQHPVQYCTFNYF